MIMMMMLINGKIFSENITNFINMIKCCEIVFLVLRTSGNGRLGMQNLNANIYNVLKWISLVRI